MIIITGVSRGLGKALVKHYLDKGETVIGLGRQNFVEHPNYSFFQIDLSLPTAINELDLSWVHGEVTLINNAGIIAIFFIFYYINKFLVKYLSNFIISFFCLYRLLKYSICGNCLCIL